MEKQTNAPSTGSVRPHLLLMLNAKRSRSDWTIDRSSPVMEKWLSPTEIQMKWRCCCRLSGCRSHARRNTLPPRQLLYGRPLIINKRLSVWKRSHYGKQKVIWWRHHRGWGRLGYKERQHLTDKSILCLRSAVKPSILCFSSFNRKFITF